MRSRRGFSLFELVIAAGLSAAFAAVVGSAFISTSSLARDSLNKASMGKDVRDVADAATRYLTGTSKLGICGDSAPPTAMPVTMCTVIMEDASTPIFISATPLSAKFYSYTTATSGTGPGSVLAAPDIIEIKYENNAITVTRQPPAATASYTNPNPTGASRPAAETVRAFDTEPITKLFLYYDAKGNQLGCTPDPLRPPGPTRCANPNALTPTEALQVALVEVQPRAKRSIGGETEVVGMNVLVSVGSSGGAL